jgi:hypothetical protein
MLKIFQSLLLPSLLDVSCYEKIYTYPIDKMKQDILELKKSITDDPFMQEDEYTAKQKTTNMQIFEEIKTSINKEKINLYK